MAVMRLLIWGAIMLSILSGCSGSGVKPIPTVAPTSDVQTTAPQEQIVQTERDFSDERITPPFSREHSGIVYKNYLLDYSEAIYGGTLGGISLENVCRSLEIKMTTVDDETKKEFMDRTQGSWSPKAIYIERGNVRLKFTVKGDRDSYYRNNVYPTVPYQVTKNGKPVEFKNVSAYKGHIYISSLGELLSALEVKFCIDTGKGNTYVDSGKITPVKGRILDRREIELKPGKKSIAELIYSYRDKSTTDYNNIELRIQGKTDMDVKVADALFPGRADYYAYGSIEQYDIDGNVLLQVRLADAPTEGIIDTKIYKCTEDKIKSVYSNCTNSRFLTNDSLEISQDGVCTYRDILSGEHELKGFKAEKPNAVFGMPVRDARIEYDSVLGKHVLIERESAINKKHFLFATKIYEYNGLEYFNYLRTVLTGQAYTVNSYQPVIAEYEAPVPNAPISSEILKTEVRKNLKRLEIENMNDSRNSMVYLSLPSGWYAYEFITDVAEGFEYDARKNKHIKKVHSFEIYNSSARKDPYEYGVNEVFGRMEILGCYKDQPDNMGMGNHRMVKEKVYSGKTALGEGAVYILDCDLMTVRSEDDYKIYNQIYAWIPIKDEQLAYNLYIDVPLNGKAEDYVSVMKKILGVK